MTKGEVASLVGINNFHLKGWLESKKLKSMQPFFPVSNREVFYIDDVIDCIKKVVEEQRQ